ncbi:methyl-accepting chemotaxis sensory transducer with Pas/Pac sensor [Desulfovibrio sp. X2]|uniref:methyl-accepting chemotaxis protein n=1 Tax=Desulfovibrio sp. X2 TaxID=941449 RepID=UPI0003587715|nr:methyl-accepting chemotaxis protein [Desulfovibrio sp. X2]EPR43851.1 methyl-accepting chemotaxis sensory transducer with Pas/Pac sensor [Desulfovibrio sp. X2]
MFKRSIGSVLVVSVSLAVIVAIAGMGLYVTRSSNTMALETSRQAVTTQADLSATALKQYLDYSRSMVVSLAGQAAIISAFETGDPSRADERFASFIKAYPDYWAMFAFDLHGKVVAGYNALGKNMAGADRSDRDYVKAILAGQESYCSRTILKAKSADKEMLIFGVSAAVHDATGKLVGGVGVFPRWDVFTEHFIDTLHFGKRGYAFAFDENGVFIAHGQDKSTILKNFGDQEFIRQALQMKNGSLFYPWRGEQKFMAFVRVPETGWTVAMTTYVSEMTQLANEQRNVLVVVGICTILVLMAIIFIISRKLIVRPVQNIETFTAAVSGGDFQAALSGTYRYELKDLAENVRSMVLELKKRLGFSQGLLDGLTMPCVVVDNDQKILFVNQAILNFLEFDEQPDAYQGRDLAEFFYGEKGRDTLIGRAMREKRPVIGTLTEVKGRKGTLRFAQIDTAPLYDLDGNTLGGFGVFSDLTELRAQQKQVEAQNERIAAVARDAAQISDQVASASEELSAQVEQASRGADEQRRMTDETATAMEEMNATVLEVAKNAGQAAELADGARTKADQGAAIVRDVIGAIGTIKDKAGKLGADMAELGGQAQDIGRVLDVISDIADQTNLLALNAAIEAARAGDAGRGFAVVADEVRKLAEKTMQATKEVTQAIGAIQRSARESIAGTEDMAKAVDQGTERARLSGSALEEIQTMVVQTADQVRGIATASEQQSAASAEISRGTESVNRIAAETAQAMEQSAEAVSDLARLAQELNTLMDALKGQ